jgi:superfamily II DNA or RNA helicase
MEHVLYEPYVKFPKIKGYLGEQKLLRLRNKILVEMPYIKHTERIVNYIDVGYNKELMDKVLKDRWNPYESRPILDVAELFRMMRKVSNSDPSRLETIRCLLKAHPKLIVFYNFNYELMILRELKDVTTVAEWNGHRKNPIPETDSWAYLVQYTAGAEGWNCTSTDAMVLYSLTYSYKNFIQCQGRIDRLDTSFTKLYYYVLTSDAKIDIAVKRALKQKRNFNEREMRVPMAVGI